MEIHNMGSCSEYTAAVNTRALFIFLPTPAELLDAKFYGSAGTLIWVSLMIIEGDDFNTVPVRDYPFVSIAKPIQPLALRVLPFLFRT
jgi:hypothetical protein